MRPLFSSSKRFHWMPAEKSGKLLERVPRLSVSFHKKKVGLRSSLLNSDWLAESILGANFFGAIADIQM
jgi:hypothetical protein